MRILILFIVLSCYGLAQDPSDSSKVSLFKNVVSTLAHDSMQGRGVGTEFEQKALVYISETFFELNKHKLRKQKFDFKLDSTTFQSENGYYFLNNRKKETIIIGAHYDHIGLGGPLSMSRKNNQVHNGADDNASGVAMLLALSNDLVNSENNKYNILFVFYGAHEVGLFGSSDFQKFTSKKKRKFKKIALVMNFDMIGRLDATLKKLKCMRSENANSFFNNSDPRPFGLELNVTDEAKLANLDTKSFYGLGIPCMNFTTGLHNDYHAVSDDSQYINYSGMDQICHYLTQLILHF